jgi:hypothetical protein
MKEILGALWISIYGCWCRIWDRNSYVMWSDGYYDGPEIFIHRSIDGEPPMITRHGC